MLTSKGSFSPRWWLTPYFCMHIQETVLAAKAVIAGNIRDHISICIIGAAIATNIAAGATIVAGSSGPINN